MKGQVFMSALVLLFGNTDYMQEKINGQNILVFICTFVGLNADWQLLITGCILMGAVTIDKMRNGK